MSAALTADVVSLPVLAESGRKLLREERTRRLAARAAQEAAEVAVLHPELAQLAHTLAETALELHSVARALDGVI